MLRYKALRYKVLLPLVALLLGACGSNAPTFEIDELSSDNVTINLNGGTIGESSDVTLKLTPKNGFSNVVFLSLVKDNGDPAPQEISIQSNTGGLIVLSGNSQVTYKFKIAANYGRQAPNQNQTTYNLKLRVSGGNVTKEKKLTLTVNK